MLNERLEACSEIADLEGLYFVWKNLIKGVSSINSLINLRLHHIGKINVNVVYVLLLFEQLKLVELDCGNVRLCKSNIEYSSFDIRVYKKWFSEILLGFLIIEKVIRIEGIKYDNQKDKYILPHHNIKYKHACYRNLLLSLGLLEKCNNGDFYINYLLFNYIAQENNRKNIMSESALLKKLEEQRMQGEAGEMFIIDYERNRLNIKNDKFKIKRISVLDVGAGYDIISFNDIISKSLDRFIEVKTYKGKPHFHWSSNEIQTAKIKSKNYYLYLVDINKIVDPLYVPIIICDPISYFENSLEWVSSPQSFLLKKII